MVVCIFHSSKSPPLYIHGLEAFLPVEVWWFVVYIQRTIIEK